MVELFLRSVQQPGFYRADPNSPDSIVQDGAVYAWSARKTSISPIAPFPGSTSTRQSAGPRSALGRQSSIRPRVVQDRIHLPGRIQLLVGGREDSLRDHNYSLAATASPTAPLAVYHRQADLAAAIRGHLQSRDNLTLYGNYGVLLSLGPQGPWWVDNSQPISLLISHAPG